ncbi:MAG: Ig-like domain-containing protein [Thiogranum sp.]
MKNSSVFHCKSVANPRLALLAILLTTASLSGCGGGGGGSSSDTVVADNPPTASSVAVTTPEDTPASGNLAASDADGDPLTFSIASQGSKGTASITDPATGTFVYTPNPDDSGTDSFTFKASDGSADSNIATVSVTITPVNDPPVAQAGSLTTSEDTQADGTLNASDTDNDPLSYSIVSQGSRGTVSITDPATGAFTYTPDANENGTDSFTFKASDGSADSNTATVSITVTPVNDLPVATGSCGTTLQAQPFNGTLSGTDLESPTFLTYSLNADGSGGAGPIVTAKGGTVTITNVTTGTYTYVPDVAAGDKRGTDTFDFQVSDTDGGTASATETVIVDQTIMPLGDSIAQGSVFNGVDFGSGADRVGFRLPLFNTLNTAGYTFDFVGSLVHGSNLLPDFNHEGHGGWTAAEIAFGNLSDPSVGAVFDWLEANPTDIVLLHAGTNELATTTATDIANILDEIDRWETTGTKRNPVTVVLALIIDRDSRNNATVAAFNNSVQIMANSRITAGDDIIIVDQQAAVNYDTDMSDNLHPGDGTNGGDGYSKMADVWFSALSLPGVLDKCP